MHARVSVVLSVTLFVCTLLAAVATAQGWSDDFDSYASGQSLYHVGGWTGWDDVPAAAGVVSSAFSRSAPNSFHIVPPATDAIQQMFAVACGQWRFTGWQYIPAGGLAGGDCWLICNNIYNHGGPYEWAVQTRAAQLTSMIEDDFRPYAAVPVVFNQWVEWVITFDLDLNTCTQTYNGAMVSTGVWNAQSGGPLVFANLDLFTTGGDCYWDDISLVPLGNQDGEVAASAINASIAAPAPGDVLDLDVVAENASTSALASVRVDLFVDPASLPGGSAAASRMMSVLHNDTVALPAGPGTTAMATFPGFTSPTEDIWRLYATVNSDEAVCGDGRTNNMVGPIILGWSMPGVGAGVCGDCNMDGFVTILDALKGSQFAAGLFVPTPPDVLVCDVDLTSTITVLDALVMAQEAAGLSVTLTCAPGGSPHLVEIASPASGASFASGDVSVRIDVWDPAGAGMDDLAIEFSTDGGATFAPCAAALGSLVSSGGPSPGGADLEFLWAASLDIPVRPTTGVRLRVTATALGIDKSATHTGLTFN